MCQYNLTLGSAILIFALLPAGIRAQDGLQAAEAARNAAQNAAQGAQAACADAICIGTYNMAMFGPSKLRRPHTLEALAKIGAGFDLMAMQEIGSNGSTATDASCIKVMEGYTAAVNAAAGGNYYGYLRGNQYGIIYRRDRFEIKDCGLYSGSQHFTYTPLVAYIKVCGSALDFIIITIHTRPSLAAREVPALAAAMVELSIEYNDPDIICLGDFNADGDYYKEAPDTTLSSSLSSALGASATATISGADSDPEWTAALAASSDSGETKTWLSGFSPEHFVSVVPNEADTTVAEGTEFAYDRIELSREMAAYYSGFWGVLKPGELWDLSQCEASGSGAGTDRALSNHYPVWAIFYTASAPYVKDTK